MNKKTILLKTTALATSLSLAAGMCGCSKYTGEDVTAYPLGSMLTSAEVIDYYAKSLDYDSVITRNIDVHKAEYETKDIQGEKATTLKELQQNCESILGQQIYEPTEESLKLVSEDTFNYIKATLDNEVLTNPKVVNITGALGFYFVDVKYDVSRKSTGEFTEETPLIGLRGAFYKNALNENVLDEKYMLMVCKSMNEYYAENSIDRRMIFDIRLKTLKLVTSDVYEEYKLDELINPPKATTDEEREALANRDYTSMFEELESQYLEPEEVVSDNYQIITPSYRRSKLDITLINKVVGSSLKQSSVMPDLDEVYKTPSVEGTISGYGIYNAGGNGLRVFGFDRNKITGTATLRYVFKDDSNGSGEIFGHNIYILDEELTSGITDVENNVLMPEIAKTKTAEILDRSDRALVNNDIAGLMSGQIYEDMGMAVLRGFKNNSTGVNKTMSTIRQILSRDMENNSYLLEIETTVNEGPRDVDSYGTYKDKAYVVIQQQGTENFIITDWIRTMRTLVSEPAINPDSNTAKRLVALNLAGEVSDDNKKAIMNLLGDLYIAGTNRVLRATEDNPVEVEINGETLSVTKGMYNCFSSDEQVLSADDLEYQNATLREALTKRGVDVDTTYKGTVSSWIGGYENQAELTTEELCYYEGLDKAYRMEVYYLVSLQNDQWVIDERKVLDSDELEGEAAIQPVRERIGM